MVKRDSSVAGIFHGSTGTASGVNGIAVVGARPHDEKSASVADHETTSKNN
jgi:hypothetical protein